MTNRPMNHAEELARELVSPETLRQIITEQTPESTAVLISRAEAIGNQLAEGKITTSQIRNIFGTVRMIEQDVKMLTDKESLPIQVQRSLQMLRPKLAYQYGRVQGRDDDAKKVAMGALTKILSDAISLVGSSVPNFRNFMDFFEAILAYHRRFGGRTN